MATALEAQQVWENRYTGGTHAVRRPDWSTLCGRRVLMTQEVPAYGYVLDGTGWTDDAVSCRQCRTRREYQETRGHPAFRVERMTKAN